VYEQEWGEAWRDAYLMSLSRALYIGLRRPLDRNGVIMGQPLRKGVHKCSK